MSPIQIGLLALGIWLAPAVLFLVALGLSLMKDRLEVRQVRGPHTIESDVARGIGTITDGSRASSRTQAETLRSASVGG